jgi:hypothetical protein
LMSHVRKSEQKETGMNLSFDIEFVRRIESNTAKFGRAWAESTQSLLPDIGIETQGIAGGIAVFAGVGSQLTQALGIGLDGVVAADELERLEKFFFERGASADFELTPYVDNSVLEWLRDRPYRLSEFSQVLALDLSLSFGEDEPLLQVTDGEIEVSIATPDEYKLFTHTVAHGYSHGAPVSERNLLLFEGSTRVPQALSFLARIKGQPAGGASLTMQNGIAGLHGGSTLREFRGSGIQTALILARLREARRRGCPIANTVTLPTGISYNNMTRFGFVSAYTRVKVTRSAASD